MKAQIFQWIEEERQRQDHHLELIASENIASPAVMAAQGSVLTNKYAEGYPGKRYYGGCNIVDKIEQSAIDGIKELFNCHYANVQPHSGSQANQGVFLALLNPGDTILGMDLNAGGHLTHGARPNLSGKWFNALSYGLDHETGLIDYDNVDSLCAAYKPKMLIAGASTYSEIIDFARMREIADKHGCYLLADVAHYSGLIAAGLYPSPMEHAHVVTSTTHKTLRGPRGGVILSNDEEIAKKVNSAIFPGLQGGPLMHVIAGKAVCFYEAMTQEFKDYAAQTVANAQALCKTLQGQGAYIVSGGTKCHMMLMDLSKSKNIALNGKEASQILEDVGIICNKNSVPGDTQSPFVTSGLRFGSPAVTSRGLKTKDMENIGGWIYQLLSAHQEEADPENVAKISRHIAQGVRELCKSFPLYRS